MASQYVKKLDSIVPLHVLVPVLIGVVILVAAGALVSKARDSDIYVPKEKVVIKVEEASLEHLKSLSSVTKASISYGTIPSKDWVASRSTKLQSDARVSMMIAHSSSARFTATRTPTISP